jgi:hypothetical protein
MSYDTLAKEYPALFIGDICGIIKILKRINEAPGAALKPEQDFTEYQYPAKTVMRLLNSDRIYPLETVRVREHERTHDTEIGHAVIHTGPYADEMARSMNALAVTIAADIFFRNGAYRPESGEGREVLAHELTHVAQYREGRIKPSASKKELEAEAEQAEAKERYEEDPVYSIEAGGRTLRFRKSHIPGIAGKAAFEIRKWLEQQKTLLDGEEYLKLLCAYESWLREGV